MDFSRNISRKNEPKDHSLNVFYRILKYFDEQKVGTMNYTLIKTCINDASFMGMKFQQSVKGCFDSPESLILVVGSLSYDSSNYTHIT